MSIERGVGDGASEVGIFADLVGHSIFIEMLFGEAEIHHEDFTLLGIQSHYKVRWLDITMNITFIMKLLDRLQHLE